MHRDFGAACCWDMDPDQAPEHDGGLDWSTPVEVVPDTGHWFGSGTIAPARDWQLFE